MKDVLEEFDGFLEKRGLAFRGTVIGGAALIVMGSSTGRPKTWTV